MTINSLAFIGFLLVSLGVFHLTPGRYRASVIFPLTNLAFLALVMPAWDALIAVLGFILMVWIALRLIAKHPASGVLVAVVALMLLVFGWLKSYSFLAFLPLSALAPTTVGLSYMLIRSLQLLADAREDSAVRPGLAGVFSFLTAWPCLVSGPVQRYQDFERQMSGMATFRLSDEIWMESLQRMAGGWFRVLVLGDATKHVWLGLKAMSLSETYPIAFGASQLMFLVHLYLDFSGYTSIVIGAGGLFGLKLPENFAHPFGARSFLDFWGRWHLTMSNWFKVYAFNPLLMLLTARWPSPKLSNAHGAAAFFVTFFLVGLWHGTTQAYVFCGLALGLCASCNQWYRSALRKRLGKKRFESLGDRLGYSMACKGAAFASLSMSVLPLWLSGAELGRVLPLYGGVGLLISQAFVFLVMAFTAVWSPPALFRAPMTLPGRCLLVAVQCLAIEMYLFLFPSFGGAFFYEQF